VNCPKGHGQLKGTNVGSIRIERCAQCEGSWYDSDELRLLKDRESHGDYCWIDFDLWKDRDKFRAARQQRYACPRDAGPMTTVHYGESSITVDICPRCKGMWLDEAEYKQVVAYLDKMVNTHTVGDYLKDVRDEFLEIFVGPEGPLSEMHDMGRVLYLLQLRFVVEHPLFATILNSLPRY
jgi:Zn-finger nucleic acid-binding protein